MNANPLVVYGTFEGLGVADASPFCLKVKTYLRMIDVPYKAKQGNPRKAPTKKIPYIDDEGTVIGDSGLILDHLKKKHGDSLDKKLTAAEHAIGHVARRTLEESLYWSIIRTRWLEDDAWPDMAKAFAPFMPAVIGSFVLNGPIRGSVRKAAFAQGVGRHTLENAHRIGCADVDAVATLLGDKPYLLGDQPTSYDATLYAFMAHAIAFPPASPVCKRANGHANVVAYVGRMKEKYWAKPDES